MTLQITEQSNNRIIITHNGREIDIFLCEGDISITVSKRGELLQEIEVAE